MMVQFVMKMFTGNKQQQTTVDPETGGPKVIPPLRNIFEPGTQFVSQKAMSLSPVNSVQDLFAHITDNPDADFAYLQENATLAWKIEGEVYDYAWTRPTVNKTLQYTVDEETIAGKKPLFLAMNAISKSGAFSHDSAKRISGVGPLVIQMETLSGAELQSLIGGESEFDRSERERMEREEAKKVS